MAFITRLVAVGITVALTSLSFAPTAHASTGAATTKAADYLAALVACSDHYAMPGNSAASSTIDLALALAATKDPAYADELGRMVGYLQAQAPTYATTPEAAAKLAIIVETLGLDPTSFGGVDLMTTVRGGIQTDGSFGAWPGPFASGLAMIALKRAGESIPSAMVTYLITYQNTDGGFGYAVSQHDATDFSDADNTSLAVLALRAAGPSGGANAALVKAVAWAAATQQSDGSWAGYAPVNSTAMMGGALDQSSAQAAAGIAYLVTQQLASGALKTGAPGADGADVYATLQAVLGLAGENYLTERYTTTLTNPALPETCTAPTSPSQTPTRVAVLPQAGSDATLEWAATAVLLTTVGAGLLTLGRRRSRG